MAFIAVAATAVGNFFAGVAGLATGAGYAASAASTTGALGAISAVGASMASGAMYGAIIGAGTSVVSGGNILEGALKGATYGGITGGIYSAGSMALKWATANTGWKMGRSAAEQLADRADKIAGTGTGAEKTEALPKEGETAIDMAKREAEQEGSEYGGEIKHSQIKPSGIIDRFLNDVPPELQQAIFKGVAGAATAALEAHTMEEKEEREEARGLRKWERTAPHKMDDKRYYLKPPERFTRETTTSTTRALNRAMYVVPPRDIDQYKAYKAYKGVLTA